MRYWSSLSIPDLRFGLKKRATALILILLVIIIVELLAAAILNFTLSSSYIDIYLRDSARSISFADAGIARAMYKIKNNDFTNENWVFDVDSPDADPTINITIDTSTAPDYGVTSLCDYGTSKRKIQAEIRKGATVSLIEWIEIPPLP